MRGTNSECLPNEPRRRLAMNETKAAAILRAARFTVVDSPCHAVGEGGKRSVSGDSHSQPESLSAKPARELH